MAEISPFRGWRYSPSVFGKSPDSVTAPPYDIIDGDFQEVLYQRNPFNIVRLILPKESDREPGAADRYESVARRVKHWRDKGIIIPDPDPRIYLYEHKFNLGSGPELVRRGFMALLRIEDLSRGNILAHEDTLAKPREDRLRMLQSSQANLDPIFFFYSDPAGDMDKLWRNDGEEMISFSDEMEVTHSCGWTSQQNLVQQFVAGLRKKKVYIADGHHRYSAALDYRNSLKGKDHPGRFVLGYFTRLEGDGLVILPVHRIIKGKSGFILARGRERVSKYFQREEVALPERVSGKEMAGWINQMIISGRFVFAYFSAGNPYLSLFRLRNEYPLDSLLPEVAEGVRNISTAILDRLVLDRILGIPREEISYSNNPLEVFQGLKEQNRQDVFIPHSVSASEVIQVVEKGKVLPPKTTFFYPKLRSGMIIRLFE